MQLDGCAANEAPGASPSFSLHINSTDAGITRQSLSVAALLHKNVAGLKPGLCSGISIISQSKYIC